MTEANDELGSVNGKIGRDQSMKRTFDRHPIGRCGPRAQLLLMLRESEPGHADYGGLELRQPSEKRMTDPTTKVER